MSLFVKEYFTGLKIVKNCIMLENISNLRVNNNINQNYYFKNR